MATRAPDGANKLKQTLMIVFKTWDFNSIKTIFRFHFCCKKFQIFPTWQIFCHRGKKFPTHPTATITLINEQSSPIRGRFCTSPHRHLLQSLMKENSISVKWSRIPNICYPSVSWRMGRIPNIRLGHAKICLRVALVGKFGQFVPISSFSDLPPVIFPS